MAKLKGGMLPIKIKTLMRLVTWSILTHFEGSAHDLRTALNLVEKFKMTDDEREAAGVRVSEDGGRAQFDLEDNDKHEWEIFLALDELNFLEQLLVQHPSWPISMAEDILDMFDQMGIDLDKYEPTAPQDTPQEKPRKK